MAGLKYGGAILTKILFSQTRMQNILIEDLLDFLIHQQLSVGFFPQLTRKHLCFNFSDKTGLVILDCY